MSKRFALFDFDKTLYDGFSLLGILQAQVAAGLVDAGLPDKIQQSLDDHEAGKITYEAMAQQQLELYADGLKGQTYDDAFRTSLDFFRGSDRLFPFAKPAIDLLQQTHEVALVTALPEPGAKAAAAVVGATAVYHTSYGLRDGVFDGMVTISLAARRGKHACVQRIEHEHSMADSFAFGDSEGDVEMLAAATHAICVRPSQGLRQEAEQRGWHICAPEEVLATVRGLLS